MDSVVVRVTVIISVVVVAFVIGSPVTGSRGAVVISLNRANEVEIAFVVGCKVEFCVDTAFETSVAEIINMHSATEYKRPSSKV